MRALRRAASEAEDDSAGGVRRYINKEVGP